MIRPHIFIASLILATAANAQTIPSGSASLSKKPPPEYGSILSEAALGSQDAPGFVALGKAGSDVVYPGSIQQLGIGILNGLDKNGNFNTGLAIQFSPYLLLYADEIDTKSYLRDQLLARLFVTLATSKGLDTDKGLYASAGFLWIPIAGDDPYGDKYYSQCLKDAITAPYTEAEKKSYESSKNGVVDDDGPDPGTPIAVIAERRVVCSTAYAEKAKFSLQFGVAPIFFSPTGKSGDFESGGIYASALARLTTRGDRLQLLASATYRTREAVPDPASAGNFIFRKRWSAGAKALVGNPKKALFGVEAAYQNADYGLRGKDDYLTYVGSFTFKVSEDFWLGLNAGGSTGRRIDGNPAFFGTTLSWGSKPTIKQ